jgi:hypothetical protein
LAAFHIPLTTKGIQFGTGKAAQKVGSALDRVGGAVRYGKIPGTKYSPGMHYAQMMQQASMGRKTKVMQEASQELHTTIDNAEREAVTPALEMAYKLELAGEVGEASDIRLRLLQENVLPSSTEAPFRVTGLPDEAHNITREEFLHGRPDHVPLTHDALGTGGAAQYVPEIGTPGFHEEPPLYSGPLAQNSVAYVVRGDDGRVLAMAATSPSMEVADETIVTWFGRDMEAGVRSQRAAITVLKSLEGKGISQPIESMSVDSAGLVHRMLVEHAVRAGKDVPAEVLADYPRAGKSKLLFPNQPHAAEINVVGEVDEILVDDKNLNLHEGIGGAHALVDDTITVSGQQVGYGPRYADPTITEAPDKLHAKGPGPLDVGGEVGRGETWKGFARVTRGINELVTDSMFEDIIKQVNDGDLKLAAGKKQAKEHIQLSYGNEITEVYHAKTEGGQLKFTDADGKEKYLRAEDIQAAGANIGETVTIPATPATATSMGTAEKVLTPVMRNRYEELVDKIFHSPEMREKGLFNNHYLADFAAKVGSNAKARVLVRKMYDIVSDHAKPKTSPPVPALKNPSTFGPDIGETSVRKVLEALGIDDVNVAAQRILERRGADIAEEEMPAAVKAMLAEVMPKNIADDMSSPWPAFKAPDEITQLGKGINSFTNLFKVGVLTWPARYVRDRVSGIARNIETGMWDFMSEVDAHNVLQGRAIQRLQNIPLVESWLVQNGLENTPENASRAIRSLYAQYGPRGHRIETDIVGHTQPESQISGLLDRLGTRKPTNEFENLKRVAKTFFGQTAESTINLRKAKIRGVGDATKTTFGPAAAGDMVGKYTDDMNRLAPFIHELRKGGDPAEAMQRINAAQVDYDPRNFTPTEKQLKVLFPFYSFSSRQIPYLAHELATNPGGRLGQLIKASNRARDPGELTPDYVSETASIPLGEQPDGSQRYITGTGMMFEDPLSYAGKGLSGAGMELLSRTNPLIKGPLELATGQSFFQRGPTGGRPLEDLDPVIGRTLANLKQHATGEVQEKPVSYPGSRAAEMLLSMSPLSRAGTTARTLTDTRKGLMAKATNLLTGFRVTDVSPGSQDAILRERLQQAMKQGGARSFLRTYFPADELATMSADEQQQALQLQALINELADRARKRAAAR